MAKKTETAKSKVAISKDSLERKIENFMGIHSGNDIIACPLDGNPQVIKPDLSLDGKRTPIQEATPPSAIINNETKDDILEGIDKLISGNSK